MKAILWKECRENFRWGAAAFVLMCAMLAIWAAQEHYSYSMKTLASDEFLLLLAASIAVLASGLGLLQFAPEIRQDQWAFLYHRGVSPSRLFIAKAVTGAAICLASIAGPFLALAAWFSGEGDAIAPFRWTMAAPGLVLIASGTGFYFAAALVALRQARWYGSRLLPLTGPGASLLFLLYFFLDAREMPPLPALAAILGSNLLLAAAAWGAFIRSGESPGQPKAASAALGIFFAVLAAALLAALPFAALDLERDMRISFRVSFQSPASDEQGGLWSLESVYRISGSGLQELRARNLDSGSPPQQVDFGSIGSRYVPLPLHSLQHETGSLLDVGRVRGSLWMDWISQDLRSERVWLYSSFHGWFLGYAIERNNRGGITTRLDRYAGPDGFFTPPALPQERFGRWNQIGWPTHILLDDGKRKSDPRYSSRDRLHEILAAEDGIYDIDFSAEKTVKVIGSPPGDPIISLSIFDPSAGAEIAIARRTSVRLYSAREVDLGAIRETEIGRSMPLLAYLPDRELASIPFPEELSGWSRYYRFGRVPGRTPDRSAFVFDGLLPEGDCARIIEARGDGGITRRWEIPLSDPPMPFHLAFMGRLCAPPGLSAALDAADEIRQASAGAVSGRFLRAARYRPLQFSILLGALLASSIGCAWATLLLSRRCGFSRRERAMWMACNALSGLAGLVALLCLRELPARTPCPACGSPRPVDRPDCRVCRKPIEPPPRDGTEIIERDPAAGSPPIERPEAAAMQ